MSSNLQSSRTSERWTRRGFLKVGAASAAGLSLSSLATGDGRNGKDVNLILLFLVGGPSQLETFDLKPNAPEHVRGPFRPIRTNVPGIEISEHLPRLAGMADRFALVRSMHHAAAPIHETGQQMMQTGCLFADGQEHPHYGAALSYVRGAGSADRPSFVVVPGPIRYTGVCVSHGQTAGPLGPRFGPATYRLPQEPPSPDDEFQRPVEQMPTVPMNSMALNLGAFRDSDRRRYGDHEFGRSVFAARRLVEQGVRCVTVNMFDTVFNRVTWDCHADGGSLASTLDDYATSLCPMLDQAVSALLGDLHDSGMLETTLVLACGEFGRTPVLNPRGGRDHWTAAWSVLLAGGGMRGGQVVGATDAWAGEVKDRPVAPENLAATVYRALGIDPMRIPGPDGRILPCAAAAPIHELF